jgi:hypothetical protein
MKDAAAAKRSEMLKQRKEERERSKEEDKERRKVEREIEKVGDSPDRMLFCRRVRSARRRS